MGARWYNPNTGTFRTRDTNFGQLNTPVSLNRYTYGNNNTLKYSDPTGREGDEADPDYARSLGFSDAQITSGVDASVANAVANGAVATQETYSPSPGSFITISTDILGNSTFVVTAPSGITVSTPQTSDRSGDLSYTPTAGTAAAAESLINGGYSVGAIATAIGDAFAAANNQPASTVAIVASAVAVSGQVGAATPLAPNGDFQPVDSGGVEVRTTVTASAVNLFRSGGETLAAALGRLADSLIGFEWSFVRGKAAQVRYLPTTKAGKNYGVIDLVDSSSPGLVYYEVKPRTLSGLEDGLAELRRRETDLRDPVALASLSTYAANKSYPSFPAVSASKGTTYGTCLLCLAAGLNVNQNDVRGESQAGLVFYTWDTTSLVLAGAAAAKAQERTRERAKDQTVVQPLPLPFPWPKPQPRPEPVPVPVLRY